MAELQALRGRADTHNYLLLHCAIAGIHELDGNNDGAINAYLDALAREPGLHERELLEIKLRKLAASRKG